MDRRIMPDVSQRQAEIKVLREVTPAFCANGNQAFNERESTIRRSNSSLAIEILRDGVEHFLIFFEDRLNVSQWIEKILDDQVTFVLEVLSLHICQNLH